MTGTARYLFAIARALPAGSLDATPGHGGAPLETVEHEGLCAVVCDVGLDEFGEEGLRTNLERLDWVERVARTHDDVVRAVAAGATVAPMRLVTICADDDSVRRRIDDLHDDLVRALDRVEGRSEWSVKAHANAAAQPVTTPDTGDAESGAAYLRRKRDLAEQRRASGRRLAEVAEEIHGALAAQSVASRRLEPQDPQLTGRSEPMVLNSAFLLADDATDRFEAEVDSLRARHPDTEIFVQGPWPPYSFAVLA